MITSNPSRTITLTMTIPGKRSFESVLAECLGITEPDIRSVSIDLGVFGFFVRTWNRRTLFVLADDVRKVTSR